MKTAIKYMSLVACVAAVSSCSSNDEPSAPVSGQVQIEATISAKDIFSRSNPTADGELQGKFNQGDMIAVTKKTDATFGEAVGYTLDADGNWNQTSGMPLVFDVFPATFRATYPGTAGFDAFTLPTDQSSLEKIAAADYMRSEVSVNAEPAGSKLTFVMQRQMARVIVELTSIDESSNGITSFKVASAKGLVSADAEVSPVNVEAYKLPSANTYYALVVPGDEVADKTFLTLVTGDGRTLTVKGIPATEAGFSYTFKAAVDAKKSITLSDPVVSPWVDGGVLPGDLVQAGGGDGTETAPYMINDKTDMQAMAEKLVAGQTIYFRLGSDIDMAGVDWTPVNTDPAFTGKIDFDGAGHTISNLTISEKEYGSLFGILNGSVRKLRVVGADLTSTNDLDHFSAIIASEFSAAGESIEQVYVNCTMKAVKRGNNIGAAGLVGVLRNATVKDCYVDVDIKYTNKDWTNPVAAVVANLGSNGTVDGCLARGTVMSVDDPNNRPYNGGVVGMVWFNKDNPETGMKITNNIGWMTKMGPGDGFSWNICGFIAYGAKPGEIGTNDNNYANPNTQYDIATQYESGGAGVGLKGNVTAATIIEAAQALNWSTDVWNLNGSEPKFIWE